MTSIWILTVWILGTTLSFEDGPHYSYDDCRKEGFRQVRDYQDGNIRAAFECEEIVTPPSCDDPQTCV
jgi:hypothetical protein